MRDIVRALAQLEEELMASTELSLNEAMALCCLSGEEVAATEIAQRLGLRNPHTSKILAALEQRQLLVKRYDDIDRRRIYYALSTEGEVLLTRLRELELHVPNTLRPLFESAP